MKFSVFVLSLYCLYVFQTVEAHVKLLHPESRVDDTGLTSGAQPCGQVKPANSK